MTALRSIVSEKSCYNSCANWTEKRLAPMELMEVEATVIHWMHLIFFLIITRPLIKRSMNSCISWFIFLEWNILMQELTDYSVSYTCSTEWTYSFTLTEK